MTVEVAWSVLLSARRLLEWTMNRVDTGRKGSGKSTLRVVYTDLGTDNVYFRIRGRHIQTLVHRGIFNQFFKIDILNTSTFIG